MSLRLILSIIAVVVIAYIVWDHRKKTASKNRYTSKNQPVSDEFKTLDSDFSDNSKNIQYNLEYDIEHEILSRTSQLSLGEGEPEYSHLGTNLENDSEYDDNNEQVRDEQDEDSKLFDQEFALASGAQLNSSENNDGIFSPRSTSQSNSVRENKVVSSHSVDDTSEVDFDSIFQEAVGGSTNHSSRSIPPIISHVDRTNKQEVNTNKLDKNSQQSVLDSREEMYQNSSDTENENASANQEQQIFYFHIKAKNNEKLSGDNLLQALLSIGCRFGESSIFHRHEKASGHGKIMFSVASMVNPGTFDIDNMQNIKTPGVVLFFVYPGVSNPLAVYDLMLKSAYQLAKFLDADVLDENRKKLTSEKAALNRQKVEDLEISEFF